MKYLSLFRWLCMPMVVAIACSGVLHAQRISFFAQHLSKVNGLPDDVVNSVVKDSEGYVWIATDNGLCRYNGSSFQLFKSVPGDSTSLPGNVVLELFEDAHRNIWISGGNFLCRYSLLEHKMHRYKEGGPETHKHSGAYVENFYCDKKGDLWMCLAGPGLQRYRNTTDDFEVFLLSSETGDDKVNFTSGLSQDAQGRYWVSTHAGLGEFFPETGKFELHAQTALDGKLKSFYNLATRVHADAENPDLVWLGTWGGGLQAYHKSLGRMETFLFDQGGPLNLTNIVFDIEPRDHRSLWVATQRGLLIFHTDTKTWTNTAEESQRPFSLQAHEVREVFKDDLGTLWLASISGLYSIDPEQQRFSVRSFSEGADFSRTVCDAKRRWLISAKAYSNRSIQLCDLATGEIKNIPIPGADQAMREPFGLFQDSKGIVWIGLVRDDVLLFDPETQSFSYLGMPKLAGLERSAIDVRSIAEDDYGFVWLACRQHGLLRYSPRLARLEVVSNTSVEELSLRGNALWARGTHNDFVQVDLSTLEVHEFKLSEATGMVRKVDVTSLATDAVGNVWVTSTNEGLFQLKRVGDKLNVEANFNSSMGFPDNNLSAMLFINENEVWICSTVGLIKFQLGEMLWSVYNERNGLYPYGAYAHLFRSGPDQLSYGIANTVVSFSPATLKSYERNFTTVLKSFRANERELFPEDVLGSLNELNLVEGTTSFSFEFTALCFSNTNQLEYAYWLQEVDEGWNYSGNRTYASYNDLSPGTYRLLMNVRLQGATWPSEVKVVTITIAPFWYQTWWFKIILVLLLVAFAVGGVQWYTRAKLREVERQLEKQRSIEAIRTRISRDIHDEIGAGLTKISLMSRKVERLAKTNDEAGEAASGLGNASRDLVQNLGEIVWTINPKNDSLADLLGYLRSYTGKFFEETGIALHLQVTEILPAHHAMRLSPEVKRNTLLILKESLNNVVKHSEATNVSVEVTLQDEQFCLVIEDNGRGFDLEMRSRSGNGLRNMQKRAEEIQGEYEVKTSVSNGTCTMLKFRLKTLAGA